MTPATRARSDWFRPRRGPSSSPIAETDADGNTYQARTLEDGAKHRVLKNFPSQAEPQASLARLGKWSKFRTWQHYWAFEYVAAGPDLPILSA